MDKLLFFSIAMLDGMFFSFTRFSPYFKMVLQTNRSKLLINKGFLNSQDDSSALGVTNEMVWIFDAMPSR